jgi:hypothetical protein
MKNGRVRRKGTGKGFLNFDALSVFQREQTRISGPSLDSWADAIISFQLILAPQLLAMQRRVQATKASAICWLRMHPEGIWRLFFQIPNPHPSVLLRLRCQFTPRELLNMDGDVSRGARAEYLH